MIDRLEKFERIKVGGENFRKSGVFNTALPKFARVFDISLQVRRGDGSVSGAAFEIEIFAGRDSGLLLHPPLLAAKRASINAWKLTLVAGDF